MSKGTSSLGIGSIPPFNEPPLAQTVSKTTTSHTTPASILNNSPYEQYRSLLLSALTAPSLFHPVDIQQCQDIAARSVSRLHNSVPAQELLQLFHSCKLAAQIGYNPGSGLISVQFPLPSPAQLQQPPSSPQQAMLYFALGLSPFQHGLEMDWLRLQRQYFTFQNTQSFLQPYDLLDVAQNFSPLPDLSSGQGSAACENTLRQLYIVNDTLSRCTMPVASQHDKEALVTKIALGQYRSTDTGVGAEHDGLPYRSVPPQPHSLANVCLFTLFRHCQFLIQDRHVDFPRETMTLILRPAKKSFLMNKPTKSGAPHHLENIIASLQVSPAVVSTETNMVNTSVSSSSQLINSANETTSTPTGAPLSQQELKALSLRYFFPFVVPMYQSDDAVKPYQYSPVYSLITGLHPTSLRHDEKYLTSQRRALVSPLKTFFWTHINTVERYYPTQSLFHQMDKVLDRYISTGLSSPRAGFHPSAQDLSLFLWGTAGTGKSTFVRVLCNTLQVLIDTMFEPDKRIEITRVPFNQTSPEALRSLLMVKGISDWSLERIVEQTVSRGGLALVHLEEQPPDPATQNELTALVQKMTDTLIHRYAEYKNNVIQISTANYPPSDHLAQTTNVIEIVPPDALSQMYWIASTAEDIMCSKLIPLVHDVIDAHDSEHQVVSSLHLPTAFRSIENNPQSITYQSHPKSSAPFCVSPPPCLGSSQASSIPSASSSSMHQGNTTADSSNQFRSTLQRPVQSLAARLISTPPTVTSTVPVPSAAIVSRSSSSVVSAHKDDSFLNRISHLFSSSSAASSASSSSASSAAAVAVVVPSTSSSPAPSSTQHLSTEQIHDYLQRHQTVFNAAVEQSHDLSIALEPTFFTSFLQFAVHVNLAQHTAPPQTHDLRQLEGWKRSVSYAILSHLLQHVSSLSTQSGLTASCQDVLPGTIVTLAVTAAIRQTPLPTAAAAAAGKKQQQQSMTTHNVVVGQDVPYGMTIDFTLHDFTAHTHRSAIPPLRLFSENGFFFHVVNDKSTSPLLSPAHSLHVPFPSALPLSSQHISRIMTILSMWRTHFLQPATIVFAGPPAQTAAIMAWLRDVIHYQCDVPHLEHFPSHEHITTKESQLFPSINTNMTYVDAKIAGFDANHYTDKTAALQHQEQSPRSNCLVSPPFTFDVFRRVVEMGSSFAEMSTPAADGTVGAFLETSKQQLITPHTFQPKQLVVDDDTSALSKLPNLHEFYAVAYHEAHKHMLFGEPDPSQSILTRLITRMQASHVPPTASSSSLDELNSQPAHKPALGVVFAAVNDPGQFYFRDLIDTGDSSTHVTKTRKDGLLFVFAIDNTRPDSCQEVPAQGDTSHIFAVQPQVISRSHFVLSLPNSARANSSSQHRPAKL